MAMVNNKTFAEEISRLAKEKVDDKFAEMQLDNAIRDYNKALRLQHQLESEMDSLDISDAHYERRYESLNRRLDACFTTLDEAQRRKADAEAQLESIRQQNLTQENVYEALRFFNLYYDKMTDKEKKKFMSLFIDHIELYPEKSRKDGVTVKSIYFKFPVSYNGQKVWNNNLSLPKENTDETEVALERRTAD